MAVRLGDNKLFFRLFYKAAITRGTTSEVIGDNNGVSVKNIKDYPISWKESFGAKLNHEAPSVDLDIPRFKGQSNSMLFLRRSLDSYRHFISIHRHRSVHMGN